MENLNNVPSTGTFGGSINQVNQNFGLVKDAIENVEGRTIRSKGLFPTQAALTAAYPSPKVGDYAYVGSSLPATIYDCEVEGIWHNTQQQGGSESVPLNDYPTKSEMNAAIAAIEIETVDNLNEETAASGKALDAHQGFVLAGQIGDVQEDVDEIEDVLTPKERTTYGDNEVASGNLDNGSVWFFFKYTVSAGQIIESIELPSAYTGTFILAFASPSTQKVLSVKRYTVSNSNIIRINEEVANTSILGLGATASQILKYGSENTGTVKYVGASSIAVGSTLAGGYTRGDVNVVVKFYKPLPSLDSRVIALENKDTEIEENIETLNNTLYPEEKTTYGDKGAASGDLNKSSVWFFFKYTVSAGQIIESIELPSAYTGTFILAFASPSTQKVLSVKRYTVSNSNIIRINEEVANTSILGLGATASQILKYGSENTGTVKYVGASSIAVGSALAGGYTRGDVNVVVKIKSTSPSFEERLEALEKNKSSISKPYGEINIIPVHGQSLSLGIINSIPAIPAHKTPIIGGLMFNTGIYQVNSGLNMMQGVKVLEEGSSTIYSSPNYETSCWGTAEMIKKRIIDKIGDNIQAFFLTCGQDGSSIDDQFDSELQVMERTMLRVKELFPYKTVKMPCFCYVQGENDQGNGMEGETYKEKLRAGRLAIQNIAERVLGQTTPVYCILYQTISGYYTTKKITQAQMELCRDEDYFAPSTSVYTLLQTPKNDRLHISAWGQYLLGQYQGMQFADLIYFGHKNVGVMPLDITINANIIVIKFKVAYPPLRFVTDWITAVTNYGFSVVSNGINIISQDGITIVDADKVQITCSQNIQSGDMLYYGISLDNSSPSAGQGGDHKRASRGNLCDSQGELYTTQVVNDVDNQLTTVALNNYCYSFYKELNL